jgi:hypothetical protein
MGKETIFINNVPVSAHISETSENLIICNSIKEEFLGISSLIVDKKSILCEHLSNSVVICNVRLGDKVYENIPFNFIIDKKGPSRVVVNASTLMAPKLFVENKKEELAAIEKVQPVQKDDTLLNEALLKLDKKNKVIADLEKELQASRKNENQQKIVTEKTIEGQLQNKIDRGIEEYKQKLFESFFVLSEEQAQLKNAMIENTLAELKTGFDRKYIKEVSEIRDTSVKEVREYTKEFLQKLSRKLNTQHNSDILEIQETVNNTLKSDLFLVTEELQNRFKGLVNTNKQELYEKLEAHKNSIKKEILNLFENYETLNRIETDKKLDKKIVETKDILISRYIEDIEKNSNNLKQEFQQHFNLLDQKISRKRVEQIKFDSNELVAEAARLLIEEDSRASDKLKKFKEQLLKELQKAAKTYTEQANKRMMRYAEMMSGGGSVAKQFAGGGTMDGDLNVTGKYLSGGVDLAIGINNISYDTIVQATQPSPKRPSGGGGGGSGGGDDGGDEELLPPLLDVDKWNSTYTTVQTYSAQWFGGPEQGTQNLSYDDDNNETLSIGGGNFVSLSALSYRNIVDNNSTTLEEFLETFTGNISKGHTVTLASGRVYIFAGTDKTNSNYYLEVNSNPITPIYVEADLSESEIEIDSFSVTDFKSAKYTLQVETSFNNEIYYSEINVVGSVGSSIAVASEYGQIFTSQIINEYTSILSLGQVKLILYYNTDPTPGRKLIIRGHRTNFYKI